MFAFPARHSDSFDVLFFHILLVVGKQIRHQLQLLIYKKTLNMRAADIPDQGRCVNLISVDSQSFLDHITYFNIALATPFFLFCLFHESLLHSHCSFFTF